MRVLEIAKPEYSRTPDDDDDNLFGVDAGMNIFFVFFMVRLGKESIPVSTPNRSSSSGVLEYSDLARTRMKGVNWKGNHRDTSADNPNR